LNLAGKASLWAIGTPKSQLKQFEQELLRAWDLGSPVIEEIANKKIFTVIQSNFSVFFGRITYQPAFPPNCNNDLLEKPKMSPK
jgi:hypothetical protein